MNKKFGKHLTIILKEMCDRVGADYDKIDMSESFWFWKHTWTTEEQDNFREWLIDYLKNNKEARQEIMSMPHKRWVKKVANEFISQYGWKENNCLLPAAVIEQLESQPSKMH